MGVIGSADAKAGEVIGSLGEKLGVIDAGGVAPFSAQAVQPLRLSYDCPENGIGGGIDYRCARSQD